jgi:hypothetical protein
LLTGKNKSLNAKDAKDAKEKAGKQKAVSGGPGKATFASFVFSFASFAFLL